METNLLFELKRHDNQKGYKREYNSVMSEMAPIIEQLTDEGDKILESLYTLIEHDDTWSCIFALEIIKAIKSEKSIPYLIKYLVDNDDSDYFDNGEIALYALQAIGKPSIKPLISELKHQFSNKKYIIYLVGALTDIVDGSVYEFMVKYTKGYIENPDKYKDWFLIDDFIHGFPKQGKKEVLSLLKSILELVNQDEQKRIEVEDTIFLLEDPEGYEEEMQRFLEENKLENKKRKLGRNDSCHCGSGIKYKKCCLEKDKEK